MTAMKLQKLVYYSQAWSLVWDDEPLFAEQIQAWANGPVVYELFDTHRGQYSVSPPWPAGDPSALMAYERETIDAVLEHYGDWSPQQLSDLTHREEPWRRARGSLPAGDHSTAEITPAMLSEYYGQL